MHGGEADQRVEGGDQLRHGGHRDAAGDDRADAAADGDADDDRGARPTALAGAREQPAW